MRNHTYIITGSSRGIGKAIALRLAAAGANITIVGKSVTEDPRLGGTIYSAAAEVEAAGGKALPVQCDIRNEDEIINVINLTVERFGGIDGIINNASAISLTDTEATTAKTFDLMNDINVRGCFLITRYAIPHLKKSQHAHILTLSPPISMDTRWFEQHTAYTISKYSMSMMSFGWAAELREHNIASNSLWPKTTINTAAIRNLLGGEIIAKLSRNPEIIADATFYILSSQPDNNTGNWYIDEEVLATNGITDFSKYAIVSEDRLQKDLFI